MRIIDVDDTETQVTDLTFSGCQRIAVVNGNMLVDEDGIPKKLPFNDKASRLAGQRIVGKVIVLTSIEVGEVLG